jgi:hypothetical protein
MIIEGNYAEMLFRYLGMTLTKQNGIKAEISEQI